MQSPYSLEMKTYIHIKIVHKYVRNSLIQYNQKLEIIWSSFTRWMLKHTSASKPWNTIYQ